MSERNKNGKPERTFLQDDGRYVLHIERALNIYRALLGVLFVIEGTIRSGPTPEYEGGEFAHVCIMRNPIGAWTARSIKEAVLDTCSLISHTAEHAYARSVDLHLHPPDSEESERKNDETVSADALISVDVATKFLRTLGPTERTFRTYSFSRIQS